ncbi:InlB B-repeat-containing protein [Treponema zuelzerae]|uniref:InlB B-repeat-containing protein n=1 Tax=Teretinema zuelzerae TaxID=156 RepID=A0AAE3EJB0_9SPIR|nr:InlB B-repeat-containing protein [Teretinema zuelzerae]MCD1655764.1 InlB B-repeat-containing protein [Teretinema zuelzerae]
MKKTMNALFISALAAAALVFSSCFGAYLESAVVPAAGRAVVKIALADSASGGESPSSAVRVLRPPALSAVSWTTLEATVRDSLGAVVSVQEAIPGSVMEFADLEPMVPYTFSVVLYSGTLATASGYASLTPLPGTNNLSVSVNRIRTAGQTGSLILDITFSDPGGLSSVSPDLYRVVSGGLEPYPWVQGSEPWTWDSISGSFSLNWGNIPSGTYLLSVSAYVAGLGSRIALGDDALVEIYDGCVSGTVSGAPISYNTEQLYSSAVRYYVSSNGGEASSGVLPNAPVLFETAVTYARDNPLATQARPARIILLDSIVLGNTVYLMSPMVVSGLTGTEKISLGMNMETSLFVVGNQISPITVALENVEVAAESGGVVYSAMNGLVSINYGVLELRPGSVITGNQGNVGGINVMDSSAVVKMLGGDITNCSSIESYGGGVSANAGLVYLESGSVRNCSSSSGGGIWLSSGAILELSELPSISFSGNSSSSAGGAVALDPGAVATVNALALLETLCDATNTAAFAFPKVARVYNIYEEAYLADAIAASVETPSFISIGMTMLSLSAPLIVNGRVALWSTYATELRRSSTGFADSTIRVSGAGADLTLSSISMWSDQIDMAYPYLLVENGASCSLRNNSSIQSLLSGSNIVDGLAIRIVGGGRVKIVDSSISSCETLGNGGGVYVDASSSLSLSGPNTQILGNRATLGGAIYSLSPVDFQSDLSDFCVNENYAYQTAGGLYDAQTLPSVSINGVVTEDRTPVLRYFANNISDIAGQYSTVSWGNIVSFYIDMVYQPDLCQLVPMNGFAVAPVVVSNPGYVFDGWYDDFQYTETWIFDTVNVLTDKPLYAQWLPI